MILLLGRLHDKVTIAFDGQGIFIMMLSLYSWPGESKPTDAMNSMMRPQIEAQVMIQIKTTNEWKKRMDKNTKENYVLRRTEFQNIIL